MNIDEKVHKIAKKFWNDSRMNTWDNRGLESLHQTLISSQTIGIRSEFKKYAEVLQCALNQMLQEITALTPAELGEIIASKKGRISHQGFEVQQAPQDPRWLIRMVNKNSGNKRLPMCAWFIDEKLDGISVLRFHAMLAILDLVPEIMKAQAA